MLVSQQSNPQPVRACLASSTLARSRPGDGRQSALKDDMLTRGRHSHLWGKVLLLCILQLHCSTYEPCAKPYTLLMGFNHLDPALPSIIWSRSLRLNPHMGFSFRNWE